MNHTNLRDEIETLVDRFRKQWTREGDEYHQDELVDDLVAVTQQERVEELELLPKIIDSNHMGSGDFVTITKDACFECHIKDRLATLQDKKESN